MNQGIGSVGYWVSQFSNSQGDRCDRSAKKLYRINHL